MSGSSQWNGAMEAMRRVEEAVAAAKMEVGLLEDFVDQDWAAEDSLSLKDSEELRKALRKMMELGDRLCVFAGEHWMVLEKQSGNSKTAAQVAMLNDISSTQAEWGRLRGEWAELVR